MVRVRVVVKEKKIQKIEICGHAESGPSGQDLVCAGVSSIVFGALNALDQMTEDAADLKVDQSISIHVKKLLDEKCQTILHVMMIQLKTIEEQYVEYIKIKQEVSS